MAINYCFVVRLASIYGRTKRKLVYATAQRRQTVTTRDIARHLASHQSPFSEGTIIGLLQDAQRCIFEHLMAGDRVNLDDLGAFYTNLSSRGAATAEEFDESLIKRVNLRWKPSTRMSKAIQTVALNRVPNRAEQRRAKKKMSELANKEVEASKAKAAGGDAPEQP
ncbi:MAG: hypothetical protein IJ197_09360 [Bacteroidaceae bacterium]|nr:hypothetical protein [Bacteroidaceae bacterium]